MLFIPRPCRCRVCQIISTMGLKIILESNNLCDFSLNYYSNEGLCVFKYFAWQESLWIELTGLLFLPWFPLKWDQKVLARTASRAKRLYDVPPLANQHGRRKNATAVPFVNSRTHSVTLFSWVWLSFWLWPWCVYTVYRPTHMQKYARHSAALGLNAAKRKAMCEFVDRLVFHNYQTMCLCVCVCVCVCALSSPLKSRHCMYKQGCKSSAELGIIGSYRVCRY